MTANVWAHEVKIAGNPIRQLLAIRGTELHVTLVHCKYSSEPIAGAQLGSLGLVLNCVVLWTTVYLDAAVRQLKAQGYPVREEDMARLSPFVSRHLGVHGTYTFALPDLAPGAIRELRDPDAPDEDDE